MTTSLPSCSSASFMASTDPSASPSGFSCVVTRNRSCLRISSATAARSVVSGLIWGELIDELGKPHPPLYGRIVLKRQLRSPLQVELPVHPGLEDAVVRLQARQRRLPGPLVAEHAHVDRRVAEIGARDDAGDRD